MFSVVCFETIFPKIIILSRGGVRSSCNYFVLTARSRLDEKITTAHGERAIFTMNIHRASELFFFAQLNIDGRDKSERKLFE